MFLPVMGPEENDSFIDDGSFVARRKSRQRGHRGVRHGNIVDYEEMPADAIITYGESVFVWCIKVNTINGVYGGLDHYETTCGADGLFTQGLPHEGPCRAPKYNVVGKATDSTSEDLTLQDVKLSFYLGNETVSTATATTNSMGRYSIMLGEGTYIIKAWKTGYIDTEKRLEVPGPIEIGGSADIDLSAVLGEGQWRIVLRWGEHSNDLDSFLYFDDAFKMYSWWDIVRQPQVGVISGLTSVLDRDDVVSYGPETTTLTGVGKCTDSCVAKFHVDNYTPEDGHLGDSDATVSLMVGSGVLKTYIIPKSAGSYRGITVFTVDASNGQLYDGDYTYGPYIYTSPTNRGIVDWSASMDQSGWSKVPDGSVMYGMGATGLSHLHEISTAKYYDVYPLGVSHKDVDVDWGQSIKEGKWALCPEGSWIKGLFREGSKEESESWRLTKAICAKFEGVTTWGTCKVVTIFQNISTGAAFCPVDSDGVPSALVGLQASPVGDRLDALNRAKCCQFPKTLVPVPPKGLCQNSSFCNWGNVGPPPYRLAQPEPKDEPPPPVEYKFCNWYCGQKNCCITPASGNINLPSKPTPQLAQDCSKSGKAWCTATNTLSKLQTWNLNTVKGWKCETNTCLVKPDFPTS